MEASATAETDPLRLLGETVAERFVVEQLVAEGGFGVVYRARQIGLDRPVALKVLKPPAGTASFQQTFEAEARTIARLVHPNIVAVHDFGVADRRGAGPLHWIALEWLDGRTLEAMLEERRAASMPPFTPAGALALLRPVIECVAFAHERGFAHRDLKPANIFLHRQAGGEVPKVLDFGVARMVTCDEEGAQSGATTRLFATFSPDYAAPEQVTHGRTGPWTDVHALGLVLTELVTGQPPYGPSSSTSEEGRFEPVISTHRPTPGSKGVGVGSWEQVLAKALSRRPAERHSDAGALLEDLVRTQPASNASAETPSPRPRRRWLSRGWLAAGVTLAVLLAIATVTWRSLRSEPTGRVLMAVLPFENLTGDPQQEYLADGLTDGMISQVGRIAPENLAVIARTSVAQYKGTKKSVKQISRELGVSHLLESSVKRGAGRIRIDARLIQASDETQVWADAFDREITDVVALQSEIARAIATGIRVRLEIGDPRQYKPVP